MRRESSLEEIKVWFKRNFFFCGEGFFIYEMGMMIVFDNVS